MDKVYVVMQEIPERYNTGYVVAIYQDKDKALELAHDLIAIGDRAERVAVLATTLGTNPQREWLEIGE